MSNWIVYPEEWFHLHGKAISGHRHSHPMRDGEDRDDPDHDHPVDDPDGLAQYDTWIDKALQQFDGGAGDGDV